VTGAPALVLFDCDGVLVDSEPIALAVLLETIAAAGGAVSAETAQDRFLGRSLAATRAILAAEFGVLLDDAALGAMRARLYDAFRAELKPIPGMAETLARIAAPVCVASSSQPERIELCLRLTGLWPWFEGRAFSATMVARGKPAPDLFLHAAREMGAEPAACLVVEDSPAGVEAGRAAGMRVIGFTGGGHAAAPGHGAALAACGAERVIADMRLLPAALEGRGA
jgi:HAD superfamily hydrolase (TIGR01509 family)